MSDIKIGDFVRGISDVYTITGTKMTKGIVTYVANEFVKVKIIEHDDDRTGTFCVDPKQFEVIGHQKPFSRDEVLQLLKDGCKKAILDYDLSGADLSGADLRGADLSGADLSGQTSAGANLSRGRPQRGKPQRGRPQRGKPQRGRPQRGKPQRGRPQRGRPQRGRPQRGKPQRGRPQRGRPRFLMPPALVRWTAP